MIVPYITGIIASLLSFFEFVAQIIQIVKTKQVDDLSYYTYIILLIQMSLWIIYSFILEAYVALIGNITSFILIFIILCLKYKYT